MISTKAWARLLLPPVVCILAATSAFAVMQSKQFTGTIVRADDRQLVVSEELPEGDNREPERRTFLVGSETVIRLDDRPAMFDDLKPRQQAEVQGLRQDDGVYLAKKILARTDDSEEPAPDGSLLISRSVYAVQADGVRATRLQHRESGEMHSGEVVGVAVDMLIVESEGHQHTFEVSPTAKITRDQKDVALAHLKAGDRARIWQERRGNRLLATVIQADTDEQPTRLLPRDSSHRQPFERTFAGQAQKRQFDATSFSRQRIREP